MDSNKISENIALLTQQLVEKLEALEIKRLPELPHNMTDSQRYELGAQAQELIDYYASFQSEIDPLNNEIVRQVYLKTAVEILDSKGIDPGRTLDLVTSSPDSLHYFERANDLSTADIHTMRDSVRPQIKMYQQNMDKKSVYLLHEANTDLFQKSLNLTSIECIEFNNSPVSVSYIICGDFVYTFVSFVNKGTGKYHKGIFSINQSDHAGMDFIRHMNQHSEVYREMYRNINVYIADSPVPNLDVSELFEKVHADVLSHYDSINPGSAEHRESQRNIGGQLREQIRTSSARFTPSSHERIN